MIRHALYAAVTGLALVALVALAAAVLFAPDVFWP